MCFYLLCSPRVDYICQSVCYNFCQPLTIFRNRFFYFIYFLNLKLLAVISSFWYLLKTDSFYNIYDFFTRSCKKLHSCQLVTEVTALSWLQSTTLLSPVLQTGVLLSLILQSIVPAILLYCSLAWLLSCNTAVCYHPPDSCNCRDYWLAESWPVYHCNHCTLHHTTTVGFKR